MAARKSKRVTGKPKNARVVGRKAATAPAGKVKRAAKQSSAKPAPAPKKRGAAKKVASRGQPKLPTRPVEKPTRKQRPSEAKPVGGSVPRLKKSSSAATPARAARQLLQQRKAIKSALAPVVDGKAVVDAYMRDVDHPFKAEMEAVRQIILGVSPKLSERIKWNAPSFYYKEDLGAFNPRATEFAHLILLFPGGGALPEKSSLLEGTHKDRREVKFYGLDDVRAKQRALEKIIKEWVALRDG
jgi:hypothetical protein